MEIQDNKVGVPLAHYKTRFSEATPEEIIARTGLRYEDGSFYLTLLTREIQVAHPDFAARYTDTGEEPDAAVTILMLRYLLEGARADFGGSFLSYPEVPWGEVYYGNFKGRCILRLAYGFGFKLEKFAAACTALGGERLETGDCAFELPFFENLRLRLILWSGDEEFPPSSQILFSDNFPLAFTAEDMAVVGDITISALKKA